MGAQFVAKMFFGQAVRASSEGDFAQRDEKVGAGRTASG